MRRRSPSSSSSGVGVFSPLVLRFFTGVRELDLLSMKSDWRQRRLEPLDPLASEEPYVRFNEGVEGGVIFDSSPLMVSGGSA